MSQAVGMAKPKVLVLVHEEGYGGGGRQSFYILEHLAQHGFPAVLVTNSATGWLGQAVRQSGLSIQTHFVPAIQRALNPLNDLWVFFTLLWIFWTEKPQVVVSAGVKLVGLGSLAAWVARVPQKVVIIRGQGGAPNSLVVKIIYAMDTFVAKLGVRFITVSEYDRQDMIAHAVCPATQITTVHNGTEIDKYGSAKPHGLRGQFNIPKNGFLVGMVGRLSPQKRYDQFIEMMAILCKTNPHVYGVLIGEGETRKALQNQINILGLSHRVFITGFMNPMASVYAELDVSVLLTRYEGCANALVESIASGLPCVTDDVCGNAEIVAHGHNGFVVPPGQVALAAQYVQTLMDDSNLRQEMGHRGRARAELMFNRQTQIGQLVACLLGAADP